MSLSTKNASKMDTPWRHWFFYGPTGAGKTTLAATFPRPVFIEPKNEGSVETLRGLDIDYYEVVNLNSKIVGGVGGMNKIIDEIENEYNADPNAFPYDTIVVESISHYTDLIIEDITNGGQLHMDQPKWGVVLAHLRNIQTRLRNLDVHVVFTALAKIDEKSNEGLPLIQGASAKKLPSSCDVIGYCSLTDTKNFVKYETHFRRYKQYDARSRIKGFPGVIQDFTFQKIEHLL